jgi:phosphopantothenoylcysteine decarboxylase/phosphopantothenate--cysteine ligase
VGGDAGRRVLITGGPTREYIDTVRFISNASSGQMGYELARAAREAGHRITLITGPAEIPDPPDIEVVRVTTAEDMLREAERVFADCDAAIMAAAVCDYRPASRADHKQPK